jgi:hypothetical protein
VLPLATHRRGLGRSTERRSPPVRRMLLAAAGPAVLAAGGCTTHAFVAQLPVGRTPASFPDRAGLATLAAHAIALTEQRLRRTRRGCSLGEAVVTTSVDGTARVTARRCEAGAGIDRAGHQPLPLHAYTGHAGVATALLRDRRRDRRQARDRKCGEAGAPRAGERTLAAGAIAIARASGSDAQAAPLPPRVRSSGGSRGRCLQAGDGFD